MKDKGTGPNTFSEIGAVMEGTVDESDMGALYKAGSWRMPQWELSFWGTSEERWSENNNGIQNFLLLVLLLQYVLKETGDWSTE